MRHKQLSESIVCGRQFLAVVELAQGSDSRLWIASKVDRFSVSRILEAT
jgi:hypothetical protein